LEDDKVATRARAWIEIAGVFDWMVE